MLRREPVNSSGVRCILTPRATHSHTHSQRESAREAGALATNQRTQVHHQGAWITYFLYPLSSLRLGRGDLKRRLGRPIKFFRSFATSNPVR